MFTVFTWLVVLTVLLIIKYTLVLPFEDKRLFELYEARDNISLAVMKNEIAEDSKEYNFVISNINFWIYNTRHDYDFSVAISNLTLMAQIKKDKLSKIVKSIANFPALQNGLNSVDRHSQRIMWLKGKVFWNMVIFLLYLSLLILRIFVDICNIGRETSLFISNELRKSKKRKMECDDYMSILKVKI